MKSILIIEDTKEKAFAIKDLFLADIQEGEIEVVITESVISGKRALTKKKYELCILDINLPLRDRETPIQNFGYELLEEIHERDLSYNIPDQIVGLTSFEDKLDSGNNIFNKYLFSLIHYDITSTEWSSRLLHLKRRLLSSNEQHDGRAKQENTICVINALFSPELDALLDCGWDWEEHIFKNDPTVYYKASVKSKEGAYNVFTAASEQMGMPSVIPLAMKMIHHFSPMYLGMTGICAGKKDEVNLGDIIMADPSWDWGNGKYDIENGKSIFKASPYQLSLSAELRNKFRRMQRDNTTINKIRAGWNEKVPAGTLKMHIGPVASGACVLADEDLVKTIETQHRKILGIEMEAYGIFSAAVNSLTPQPIPFVLKSVCDYADSDKHDKVQKYAAYTSAHAFKVFVEEYL